MRISRRSGRLKRTRARWTPSIARATTWITARIRTRRSAGFGNTAPLSVSSLDDLRSQILSDMKGGELDDALAAGGAELAHDLDSSAMNKLPAKKIVNNSANS